MFINADGLECVREQEGSLKYGGRMTNLLGMVF